MGCVGAAVVLICGLSSIAVTGQEMEEHSREDVRKLRFSVGTNASISVEGDVTEGCRFLFLLDIGTCCYSAKERGDSLCDPFRQPEACRGESFTVTEQAEPGLCVLHLPDFQPGDVGSYRTVFPGSLEHNQDHAVTILRGWLGGEIAGLAFLCLVVLILLILPILLILKTLWSRRGGGFEERRGNDEKILRSLLQPDSEDVAGCVGDRNILRARDKEGNNIYHYASQKAWEDRSTQLLDNELRRKGIFLKELSESPHSTSSSPQTTPRDPAIMNKSPVTTADIFSAKIPNRFATIHALSPALPLPAKLKSQTVTIDVNTTNQRGESPLHVACDRENKPAVEALLNNNAKINVLDATKSTPVHKAVTKGNLEILKLLLPKGDMKEEVAEVLGQKGGKDHLTPLGIAVKKKFDKIVKYVIEELGDETWKEDEVSFVYWAIQRDDLRTLDILVSNGAVWTKEWKFEGTTFLQSAAKEGNLKAVKTIITRGYYTEEDKNRTPAIGLVEEKVKEGNKIFKDILNILQTKRDCV